ncbi:hypothetical protein [Spiroplasma sp. BIUS-1]|uniref:hypothetical protein n=1 Tax=Spiroplasma sp. BIUS-1 TaxID=216964 RepID=UPI0013984D83|nr:hypothetical protein [Spiroplasma sp. BIUS-1]QHX36747.1 hypothetical protein SBIUS_v1c04940 [Spiroplasma sp. BIUS-1]
MIRFSKTLSHVSIYLLLATLMPVMVFSIIMISLKDLVNKGYELLNRLGEWLTQVSESGLSTINSIGWTVLIICLIAYGALIFNLVLINSRKSYKQRIGYFLALGMGIGLFIVSLLPIIIFNSTHKQDPVLNLLLGLLIVFIGLNGGLLTVGSIFGLISAKTSVDTYEDKKKVAK